MSSAPLRAVLFDAAGTLIRLREPVGTTYARFAREHGVDVPASRLEEAFHRVLAAAPPRAHPGETLPEVERRERAWWRRVVDDTLRAADGSARPADFEALFAALFEHYAGAGAWEPAPGATALLAELRAAGVATGVVSNFDQRLRRILQELGIHDLLDVVTLPSDSGAEKPDPTIFQVALKRLGLAGHDVAYVGDDPERDVAAARKAGLRTAVDVRGLATLADLPRQLGLTSAAGAPEAR